MYKEMFRTKNLTKKKIGKIGNNLTKLIKLSKANYQGKYFNKTGKLNLYKNWQDVSEKHSKEDI